MGIGKHIKEHLMLGTPVSNGFDPRSDGVATQTFAPCNVGDPTGAGATTGTPFFKAMPFVFSTSGIITGINFKGIGNAGNSGASEDIEWGILTLKEGALKVDQILGSGIKSVVNTSNAIQSVTGLSIAVPSQFIIGIIGVAGGQFNAELCEKSSFPGIPIASGSVTAGYPQAVSLTYDVPAVDAAVTWGGNPLLITTIWTK